MKIMHKTLADNRWQKLSFSEQMANIGSEFGRAVNLARLQDEENKEKAIFRLLELIDLTISFQRKKRNISEISRLREAVCDFFYGSNTYNIFSSSLNRYFLFF